jgi:DNA mismatch repair protein MutL
MGRIRTLSLDLQNKIAAGEVIERPASVVKELLENSLDAGAKRIEIQVEDGGRKLIKIIDDGCGIEFDDLLPALAPHATSKVQREEDLYHIETMGFRGEALASIAAIAHVTVTSRPANAPAEAPAGGRITAEGGTITEPVPCGCPSGTTVEVRNLFFNTPARRKFLKTAATEISHITEQVARIALASPGVAFKVSHNGKVIHDLPAVETFRKRIGDFFGPELTEALIAIQRNDEPLQLYALVSRPVDSRATPRWQYTWLNGRYIRDRFVQHAVREAYRGLMDPNRQPVVFIYLHAGAEDFDVNVHPTKIEVRWSDSGLVHGVTLSALRESLLQHDNTPALDVKVPSEDQPPDGEGFRRAQQRVREAIADFFREASPVQRHLGFPRTDAASQLGAPRPARSAGAPGGAPGSASPGATSPGPVGSATGDSGAALENSQSTAPARPSPGGATPLQDKPVPFGAEEFEKAFSPLVRPESPPAGTAPAPVQEPGPEAAAPDMARVTERPAQQAPVHAIQLHNTYLVAETADGIVIVDQHALHERVLYEQLRSRVAAGRMEAQHLLLAEAVNVPPDQVALVVERADLLSRLGIEATQFGPNAIAVNAFPSLVMGRVRIGEFMSEMLGKLAAAPSNTNAEKLLDEVLNIMACKAAVKAGDPLSADEIVALLANWQQVEGSSNCPHGRPTVLRLSLADLEKQFHRV